MWLSFCKAKSETTQRKREYFLLDFFFPLMCFIILKSPINLSYYMLYSNYLINILLYCVYYSLDKYKFKTKY